MLDCIIVSNGNHTETISKGLEDSKSFYTALHSEKHEPDIPNYTPRISGIILNRWISGEILTPAQWSAALQAMDAADSPELKIIATHWQHALENQTEHFTNLKTQLHIDVPLGTASYEQENVNNVKLQWLNQ